MNRTGASGERAGERHRQALLVAFGLVVAYLVVQIITALATGSLALLSDAGHMATDAIGIGMALAAIVASSRAGRDARRTYGLYRLEILAALANAALLTVVSVVVVVEALRRLGDPPVVDSGPVLVVAAVGLAVNVVAWRLLRRGASESLNVEGAYLEVVADLAGSAAVVVSALLVRFAGWDLADPLFAVAIGAFILPRAWRLGRRAVRILIEAAPEHLDVDELRRRLGELPGVVDVHDLHVWTLTSEMEVASVHLTVADAADGHEVLDLASRLMRDDYAIGHATLQVEPDSHQGCVEAHW